MADVRPNFYCIDAQDGAGKTVQIDLLEKRIRAEGLTVNTISFPRYETPTGQQVRDYLGGKFGDPTKMPPLVASMFFALDRQAAIPDIKRLSGKSSILLANRYVSSNLAHQGGKIQDKKTRVDLINDLLRLEYDFFDLPEPFLTIILGVDPEISYENCKKRAMETGKSLDGHEINFEHIKNSAEVYRYLAQTRTTEYKMVECCEDGKLLSPEIIHQKIWAKSGHIITREKFRG